MDYSWDGRALLLLLPGLAVSLSVPGTVAIRLLWGVLGSAALPAASVLPWALCGAYRPWLGFLTLIVLSTGWLIVGWRRGSLPLTDPTLRKDPWPDVWAFLLVLPVAVSWGASHPWPRQWNGAYLMTLQMGEWLHTHGRFPTPEEIGHRYTISPALYPPLCHATAALAAFWGKSALVTWAAIVGKAGLFGLAGAIAVILRLSGLQGASHAAGSAAAVGLALAWQPDSELFWLLTELNQDSLLFPVVGLLLAHGLVPSTVNPLTQRDRGTAWCAVALIGWVRPYFVPFAAGWVLSVLAGGMRARRREVEPTGRLRPLVPQLGKAALAGVVGLSWCAFLFVRYGSLLYPFQFGPLRGYAAAHSEVESFFQKTGLYFRTVWENLANAIVTQQDVPFLFRISMTPSLIAPLTLFLAGAALVTGLAISRSRFVSMALLTWTLGGFLFWLVLPAGGSAKPLYLLLPVSAVGWTLTAVSRSSPFLVWVPWVASVTCASGYVLAGCDHRSFGREWRGWVAPPRSLAASFEDQYGVEVTRFTTMLRAGTIDPASIVMFNVEHSGLLFLFGPGTPVWEIAEYRGALYDWHIATTPDQLAGAIRASGYRFLFAPPTDYLKIWHRRWASKLRERAPELLTRLLLGRRGGVPYRVVRTVHWSGAPDVIVYDLAQPAEVGTSHETESPPPGLAPPAEFEEPKREAPEERSSR